MRRGLGDRWGWIGERVIERKGAAVPLPSVFLLKFLHMILCYTPFTVETEGIIGYNQ